MVAYPPGVVEQLQKPDDASASGAAAAGGSAAIGAIATGTTATPCTVPWQGKRLYRDCDQNQDCCQEVLLLDRMLLAPYCLVLEVVAGSGKAGERIAAKLHQKCGLLFSGDCVHSQAWK